MARQNEYYHIVFAVPLWYCIFRGLKVVRSTLYFILGAALDTEIILRRHRQLNLVLASLGCCVPGVIAVLARLSILQKPLPLVRNWCKLDKQV